MFGDYTKLFPNIRKSSHADNKLRHFDKKGRVEHPGTVLTNAARENIFWPIGGGIRTHDLSISCLTLSRAVSHGTSHCLVESRTSYSSNKLIPANVTFKSFQPLSAAMELLKTKTL